LIQPPTEVMPSSKESRLAQHNIIPLLLSQVRSEKGPMTYLVGHGQPIIRPYVFWYIRAEGKNVLVDTAIEADDYRNYHPGFSVHPFEAIQTFEEALAKVDCKPEDIDIVIQTHLHMDHMYNTAKCTRATIYVQQAELEFALDPHPIFKVLFPRQMIQKLKFEAITGDRTILPGIDVFSAPGHTPGCQAVAVETTAGKAVISGGCSIMENYFPPEDIQTTVSPFGTYPVIAPGIHTNLFQAYDSALKIKQTADLIIPMHDPVMASKDQIP